MTDITDEERARRIAEKRRETIELRNNPHTPRASYWLSFCDETGFLGVVVVDDCVTITDAIDQSIRVGVNPGGEVLAIRLVTPPTDEAIAMLAATPRLRLLSADDLAQLGYADPRVRH